MNLRWGLYRQVQDKTWAAIRKWTPLSLTGPWFEVTAEKMRHLDHPETQFCSVTSCRDENSEAFAGQHERTSSSFYIFDEASAVPDSIYEVAEGGLTDGVNVLAVIVPRLFVRVLMIQLTIQATSVLLPMPCPLDDEGVQGG